MNKALLHLAAASCLVAAGTLCFLRFAWDTPRALPAAVGEYLDDVALSVDLQTRVETDLPRIRARHEVLEELLAGRLTLLEAAARFQDLDAGLPEVRDRRLHKYPGVPYEVAVCRQVIERARSVLKARASEQAESIVARLEAELQAHLGCERCLCLP